MSTLAPHAPALGWSVHDTSALIGRCVRRSLRQLDTVLMAVILPVVLLLLFVYVFGGAIQTGGSYVNWVVPGIVLLTAGYGSATTAVDVAGDMTGGIIDRFRSLPIRPTGVLTGHVVASMARNAISTALVIDIAFVIGFDAAASPLAWLGAIGLIALFVLALTWVAVAIGLVASGPEAASGFTFAILFLPYVSSAFVPPESMPAVLEVLATYNPITPVTDTLRSLLAGAGAGDSWLAAVVWCTGIFLVARLGAAWLFRRTR
ncbi:ABC transporter permease [Cellulomonas fengjieae]|uniref:ABC transporter permease n=1 Tax=Cellulomonas fengjieae TaxID=2819978 RepID=UPI001AAE78D2|nr:ABC transporter permease [Cellulomonas fengjieae]MBO3101047.1 ABC transporter permease [Cellulomonas fengjieae]